MFQIQTKNAFFSFFRKTALVTAASIVFAGAMIVNPVSKASAATSSGTTFASVDMQKVLNAYKGKSASVANFQKVADLYDATYKLQQSSEMLSSADQTTLGQLLLKPSPTPADQTQIKALQTKSDNDAAQLAALSQKATLTDTDKAQLTQLSQEKQASAQILQDTYDSYKQILDGQNQVLMSQVVDEVRSAVSSVAQKQGISVVFDAQYAIYAGTDLTQAVIAKLNAIAGQSSPSTP